MEMILSREPLNLPHVRTVNERSPFELAFAQPPFQVNV